MAWRRWAAWLLTAIAVLRRWVGRVVWYTGAAVGWSSFILGVVGLPVIWLMNQTEQWLRTGRWPSY